MFPTYLDVLLPGEVGLPVTHLFPGFRLRNLLGKHVGVAVDDALDPRLVVKVRESGLGNPVQHLRRLGLSPRLARPVKLHTDIMYPFINSRTYNECVVLRNVVR